VIGFTLRIAVSELTSSFVPLLERGVAAGRIEEYLENLTMAEASDRLVDQGGYTVPVADHDLLTRE
jgi:hypothetical protein